MTVTASELGNSLLASIQEKNAADVLDKVRQFRDCMKDSSTGASFVVWITDPANLLRVHTALSKELNIPTKLLAIKRMPITRTQRAMLFTQAMELGIKKVHLL